LRWEGRTRSGADQVGRKQARPLKQLKDEEIARICRARTSGASRPSSRWPRQRPPVERNRGSPRERRPAFWSSGELLAPTVLCTHGDVGGHRRPGRAGVEGPTRLCKRLDWVLEGPADFPQGDLLAPPA